MAQLEQNTSGKRSRRQARVDMTAMVDVAFLLLTFFILTTTMVSPKVMELNTPKGTDEEGKVIACSKMMIIHPGAEGQFHFYPGCDPESIETTDLRGIRNAIFQNIASVNDLIISIKPTEKSTYKTVVDILDEMKITGARKYALSKITEQDNEFLAAKGLK